MSSKELVVTALHVLVAWNEGSKPAPADIQILNEAFPALTHLPVDELCCWVINNLGGRALHESGYYPIQRQLMDEVA